MDILKDSVKVASLMEVWWASTIHPLLIYIQLPKTKFFRSLLVMATVNILLQQNEKKFGEYFSCSDAFVHLGPRTLGVPFKILDPPGFVPQFFEFLLLK